MIPRLFFVLFLFAPIVFLRNSALCPVASFALLSGSGLRWSAVKQVICFPV